MAALKLRVWGFDLQRAEVSFTVAQTFDVLLRKKRKGGSFFPHHKLHLIPACYPAVNKDLLWTFLTSNLSLSCLATLRRGKSTSPHACTWRFQSSLNCSHQACTTARTACTQELVKQDTTNRPGQQMKGREPQSYGTTCSCI